MKKLLIALLLLLIVLGSLVGGIYMAPYWLYRETTEGRYSNDYYQLNKWSPLLLAPVAIKPMSKAGEDYGDLWKDFHIVDAVVPLPTRHPMFRTIPIIKMLKDRTRPEIGMIYRSAGGRDVINIYLLKGGAYSNQLASQKLFLLPIARNLLKNLATDQVWKDIFTKKIAGWEIPHEEMIYNLYLMQMRSSLLPDKTVAYGLLPNGKTAIVQLESQDKDYLTELVFTQENGMVFSYLLVTDQRDEESMKLRTKVLEKVEFRATDPSLTPIIYREFKQLSFQRQTDQEGMLYLFSAWSHDMENQNMVREMIYFLERGDNNRPQLRPLYRFAMNKFKRTFTTRPIGLEYDEEDIKLQRQIELEDAQEQRRILEKSTATAPVKSAEENLSAKEKMDLYLKKAREEKSSAPAKIKKKKLIVH